jgi:CAAX protease family protein
MTASSIATNGNDRHARPAATRVTAQLRAHPILGFFAVAYAFSWLAQLVCLGLLGQSAMVAIFAATLGPTVAAVVMAEALEGPAPGRHQRLWRVVRGVRIWRVGARWYALALLGVPAAYLGLTLLLPGASLRAQPVIPLVIGYLVMLAVGAFSGPVFEEPGWRGFALPRLQARMGPLAGTLVLGVLWGCWHLPQFLIPAWASENGGLSLASVGVFILTVVAIAVLLTWVYNRTGGSLLLTMLVHASVNTAQAALVNTLVPSSANSDVSALFAFGLVSLALVLLTRGRLGYAPPTHSTHGTVLPGAG